MANKLMLGFLLVLVVGLTFVSGCVEEKAVCGNGKIEAGEECDGAGCAENEICSGECKCVASASQEIPSPPPLPA